jgi:hypothetical protein
MANRITAAIDKLKKVIPERIAAGQTTQEAVNVLCDSLDMGLEEYAKLQELKSLASTTGLLSVEEAMTVYGFLGESIETFNKQPVEVKSVLTQMFGELLEKQLAARV